MMAIHIIIASCTTPDFGRETAYLRWVGDIAFNKNTDRREFFVCDEENIKQYHNFAMGFQYKGEKPALVKEILEQYKLPNSSNESGYLRIRFVVNCKGETDRFRTLAMDYSYQEMAFSSEVEGQLTNIVKKLEGWKILPDQVNPKDYYMYLIFKINNGQLVEILP